MEDLEPVVKRRKIDGKGGKEARRWTRAQLESVVQGSEEELGRGLKERNVIELDGMSILSTARSIPHGSIVQRSQKG